MTWSRFKTHYLHNADLDVSLDISRVPFPDDFFSSMEPAMQRAFDAMTKLEAGAIANPDEKRMVGHYWLRAPQLAPTPEITGEITTTLAAIKAFTAQVHSGAIAGPKGKFKHLLVIGIGGSALGPQLVSHALGRPRKDKLAVTFFDNTDPDGMDYVLGGLRNQLAKTLVIVISKSGGTAETRNGMLEAMAAFRAAGLEPAKQFVAVTGAGSKLDQTAQQEGWLARFAMWDWVGGRTSELSAVGLLPAALQGIDIQAMLDGAAAMDEVTRYPVTAQNPAALMALMWHFATDGRGAKDMVVLPYKDRLLLFSRYLQQLVMESLGKEHDLDGKQVFQGIAVYGNKGSTDQHAYVQQLRDGVANFFATFIEVRKGRDGDTIEVEPGNTCADYLQGFLRGTRSALYQSGRKSITISLPEVSRFQVGLLIALYERAVSFYASLVNINAYHQPGVEAGKKAAATFLDTLNGVRGRLTAAPKTATDIAREIDADAEDVYHCLTHLSANGDVQCNLGATPAEDTFGL